MIKRQTGKFSPLARSLTGRKIFVFQVHVKINLCFICLYLQHLPILQGYSGTKIMLLSVWGRRAVHIKIHKETGSEGQYTLFFLVRPPITHRQNISAFHFREQKEPFPCSYWEQHTTYATWMAPSQKSYKKRTHAISYTVISGFSRSVL